MLLGIEYCSYRSYIVVRPKDIALYVNVLYFSTT